MPTDEEINEMIARTDDEFDLFQKMDIERDQARGTSHRLMQEVKKKNIFSWCFVHTYKYIEQFELPSWLLEEPVVGSVDDMTLVYGRGFRDRPKVDYDDGLTDKQWEKKLIEYDEGISSPSTPSTPPPGGSQKRKRSKGRRNEDELSDIEEEETPNSKRKSSCMQSCCSSDFELTRLTASTPRTRGSAKQKSTPSSTKRAKKNPKEDASNTNIKAMDTVWDIVRKATDEEGRQYSALFFRLPSKKEYLKTNYRGC